MELFVILFQVCATIAGLAADSPPEADKAPTPPAATQPDAPAATPNKTDETPVSPAGDIQTMDELLDAQTAADAGIQDLIARVRYQTIQGVLGDEQTRLGTVTFRALPDEKRTKQFSIQFRELIASGGIGKESQDWIFDGRYLVERDNDEKDFIKREVVQEGKSIDPLSVDGPFPLPIGQSKESILRRFKAELLPREDRAGEGMQEFARLVGFLRVRLTALRADDDLATVELWYHPESFLPHRAHIVERGGDEKIVDLIEPKVNAGVDAALFSTATPPLSEGWRIDVQALQRDEP